jgi:methionine synthase I (cobalamin-dependent)/5,10-methylenetetrahydrofolate reductase
LRERCLDRNMDIRKIINQGPVIFDGAMGTYLAALDRSLSENPEKAAPELVEAVHREYIRAGAQCITTNTFSIGEIDEKTIEAAWDAACRAAGNDVFVFADMGPAGTVPEEAAACYIRATDKFLEIGARHFIFETLSTPEAMLSAAAHIKEKAPESYIIASFSCPNGGYTRDGLFAGDVLRTAWESGHVDCVGLNCALSAGHMAELMAGLDTEGMTLIVMPNAGYPVVLNNRTFYEGDPVFFAGQMGKMAAGGVTFLGGCCGTTPAHIKQIKRILEEGIEKLPESDKVKTAAISSSKKIVSNFWDKLISGQKPVAVELDPPASADLTRFMEGAKELKDIGADIMTLADCPIGRARMDSSLLACKVFREVGIETLPHMTCRDRNLNATKALMLGLYAEGIRNLLIVTGDPIPTAERDEVKSVYQFNSRKMAAFAASLNEKEFNRQMHFFGALNINARNFDVQIGLAREKAEHGIAGFLTQPVLTREGFENLKRAKAELGGYILGGIIPIVSERNARFMDSEINGINVAPEVIELYVGKDKEESEEIGIKISTEIARRIEPYVDGFYFMAPFLRTGMICKIIENIRNG